jgi:membrane protease subunit (stomatin/prohibitin family)
VRRERRALVRAREDRIRDLGGLMLEMYKREQFRAELFYEQCAELISIEERIQELDGALASLTRRTLAEANRCACGAPLVSGAHFCANCGRAVGEAAVVACAHCGNPLPAEATFCSNCGRPAEPADATYASAPEAQEQTAAGRG